MNLNTKFAPPKKIRESSYQVRETLALICNLVALVLGENYEKDLKLMKIVKPINFKTDWGKLEAKNRF